MKCHSLNQIYASDKILISLLAILLHSCFNTGLQELNTLQLQFSELSNHNCRELNWVLYYTQVPSCIVQVWILTNTAKLDNLSPHFLIRDKHDSEAQIHEHPEKPVLTEWECTVHSYEEVARFLTVAEQRNRPSGGWALADERRNDEAFTFRCPSQTEPLQQKLFLVEKKMHII